jgi:insulysin
MGNINEEGAQNAVQLIDNNFLAQARPLQHEELPRLRSHKMPTRKEAERIFGPEVGDNAIPVVVEEVAHSESEENHAIEMIMQAGAEHELGYEGIAIIELISQMAYTSAYNQLRTTEQLGKSYTNMS